MELERTNESVAQYQEQIKRLSCSIEELQVELDQSHRLHAQQQLCTEQMSEELEKRISEMDTVRKELEDYKSKLTNVQENVTHQNMLNLEMADYERTLSKVQDEVASQKMLLQSKNNENASLQKELDAVKEQKQKSDTSVAKLKSALVKFKKELNEAKQQKDERNEEVSMLTEKLQIANDELDSLKVESSSNAAGAQQRATQLEATAGALRRQLHAVTHARDALDAQLAATTRDYETYKTRVHTVLKQQQSKGSEEADWAAERKNLQAALDDLKQKLNETNGLFAATQVEVAALTEENDRLTQRNRDQQLLTEKRQAALRTELEQSRSKQSQQLAAHEKALKHLELQAERLKEEYQERTAELQQKRFEEGARLEETIAHLETEILSLKTALAKQHSSGTAAGTRQKTASNGENSGHGITAEAPPFAERKPGEGQENPTSYQPGGLNTHQGALNRPHKPPKLSIGGPEEGAARVHSGGHSVDMPRFTPSPEMTPLEDLLISDQISVSSVSVAESSAASMSTAQVERLLKRLEHSNELLRESEAGGARLAEQTLLLKDEIRRLERNQQRQQHLANNEYLKNVVIKVKEMTESLVTQAHTTRELLRESEAGGARLAEQTLLLKDEIRRLERNQQRQQHLANNEYLKNVVIKFLSPKLTDERSQLIPVLKTMLKLSPEEVDLLQSIAKDDKDEKPSGSSSTGWNNYFHRWSGLT